MKIFIFFIFILIFLHGSWPHLPVLNTGVDDTSSGGHVRQPITDVGGHGYGRRLLGGYETSKLAINIWVSY